jgi:hypothetical protein
MRTRAFLAATAAFAAVAACSADADLAPAEANEGDALPVLVTAKEPQDAYISNLSRGLLTVDDQGCLRHGAAFVIWPYGSKITRTAEDQLQVTDGASRKAVLVGQEIGMSGVDSDELPDTSRLAQAIPEQCGGPYKWGGPVMTEAELRTLDERDHNRVPVPLPPEAERSLRPPQ